MKRGVINNNWAVRAAVVLSRKVALYWRNISEKKISWKYLLGEKMANTKSPQWQRSFSNATLFISNYWISLKQFFQKMKMSKQKHMNYYFPNEYINTTLLWSEYIHTWVKLFFYNFYLKIISSKLQIMIFKRQMT